MAAPAFGYGVVDFWSFLDNYQPWIPSDMLAGGASSEQDATLSRCHRPVANVNPRDASKLIEAMK